MKKIISVFFIITCVLMITCQTTKANENETYDFYFSKEKIEINVGTNDKVEIMAMVKEGIYMIDIVEMVKDNWVVEWKIEDETIAKYVVEKGIENNQFGGRQTVGRVNVQGLKPGTTMLIAKIKVDENEFNEMKIPVIVKGSENSDSNNDGKKDEKKNDNKQEVDKKDDGAKVDNTIANQKLAKTGETEAIIIFMGASIVLLIFNLIKK